MKSIEYAIDRIRSERLEKLEDESYLEFKLLPELGLNDRHLGQFPSFLHRHCGGGVRSWQYPNQFSRYLRYLAKKKISSYAEIGCHKGGTFIITVEYLSRFQQIEYALGIDNWERDSMRFYEKVSCGRVKYLPFSSTHESSRDEFSKKKFDLVLIDGDHSLDGVTNDWFLVKDSARFVALHDICNRLTPGVSCFWNSLKLSETSNFIEYKEWTEQYDEVLLRVRGSIMGLGLVELGNSFN